MDETVIKVWELEPGSVRMVHQAGKSKLQRQVDGDTYIWCDYIDNWTPDVPVTDERWLKRGY